jgi:hypothetical protein
VRFAAEVRRLHRRYRVGILRYLGDTPPLHIATAPLIYAMFVPLALLDIALITYPTASWLVEYLLWCRVRQPGWREFRSPGQAASVSTTMID